MTNFLSRYIFIVFIIVQGLSADDAPQLGKSPLKEVIKAMTPEEKVGMVMGTGMMFPGLPSEMAGPDVGPVTERVPGAAGNTFAIPRLGIPAIVLADGPAGVRINPRRKTDSTRTFYCTAFPIARLLASTWDIKLVERAGVAFGNELKEYGADLLLAPALNTHRNPLGGRNFEYYSEDPLISGKMAAAMVRGVQSQGVGATLKHFAANNHEWNRFTIDIKVNERALREIYLKGFRIAVMEGKPWAIMTSYNKINGTYTSESKDLLTSILRDDWGFDGLVMTDWFGGQNSLAQMKAGNNLLMPGTKNQQETLIAALKSGNLDEKIVDRNIEHILNIILRTPAFKDYTASNAPNLQKNAKLSRESASAGMILLKNSAEVLPIESGKNIALLGNSSYETIIGGTGSGDVNEAYSVSLDEGLTAAGFKMDKDIAQASKEYLLSEKEKQKPQLMPFMPIPRIAERPMSDEEIDQLVSKTDIAVITIGRHSGEFRDLDIEKDFHLREPEKQLIEKVSNVFHQAEKKVVVILNIGSAIETASWRDQVDAILLAWHPGQEAGHAITDVLSGKVNPSGKLATTFPLNYDDVPSSSNFPGNVLLGPDPENQAFFIQDRAAEVEYNDGIWVGYRYFKSNNIKPAYPFGFGLSYTRFDYSDIKLSSENLNDKLKISVKITNTGKANGREVVQLYLNAPKNGMQKPAAELKGFHKTTLLKPGESEIVSIELTADALASFDPEKSTWIVEDGQYIVHIGSSSEDIRQSATFEISQQQIVKTVSRSLIPDQRITVIKIND